MLTPEQLAHCTDDIVELYTKLNEEIVRDIARRVAKASDVTPTGRLQILALQNVGMLTDDILQTVSKYSGMSDSLLYDLFEDAGIMSVEYDMEIYTKNGLNPLPLNMSPAAMQTLEAGYRKTNGNLRNLTGTTAVTSQTNFINACTMAEMKAESGAFSPQQAIIDAVKQLAADGAVVRYPSGHKDKLDVAVRRNVMTGIGQTTGEVCLGYARELEWDLMEITAHAGARPSHARWQGQIVSLSGRKGYLSLDDIGYGTGEGFKGYNCRHDWYPYSEGSARMYTAEEIAKLNAKDIEFPDGSMHTLYEAEQYQRAYERRIRETKRILAAKNEFIINTDSEPLKRAMQSEFDKKAITLKRQEAQLKDFCKKTGLRIDSSRMQKYGFGRSTAQKAVWSNKKKTPKVAGKHAIRNTGKKLTYNPNADFSISLESYNDQINKSMSKASAKVAELGGKDNCEHLILVNLLTGKQEYYEDGTENYVGLKGFFDFIEKNKNQSYAFVHNHTTDGYFSETDMRTLLTNDCINVMIATRIDGIRYITEKTAAAPNYAYFDKLFQTEINELNLKARNGIISAGERTRLREEIIVNGLLKKYTKGLIELG